MIQEQLREETESQHEPPAAAPPIIEQEEQKPAAAPDGPSFTVREVLFRGNTVIRTDELQPLASAHTEGRRVTLRDLQVLAERIQREYRSRGYLTTIAFVPPQKIEDGRVTIEILEGRFGKLEVEGSRYTKEKRLRAWWPIEEGQVLRYQDMRRSLKRMNLNPDRKVQALMRPGAETGTTDVVLRVQEKRPLHASAFVDQRGTKAIGLQRLGGSLRHTNLLGFDDQLVIGAVGGQFFGAGFAQYSVPLGPWATRLVLAASHAQVAPRRQFKRFGVNGTSETYSAKLAQMLVNEDRRQVEARIGLDVMESRTVVSSSTSRRDRLRVLRLESDSRFNDRKGAWAFEPQLSFGIGGLGASKETNPVASRIGAKPDFVKFKLQATRAQRLPWTTQLIASVTGQIAGSKLVTQEELYMGGATTVRGYPEGDYLADDGVYTRLDYVVPFFFAPQAWKIPLFNSRVRESVSFLSFFDRGYGQLRGITGSEKSTHNMTGLGIGMLFQTEDFLARVEWGFNLGDKPLTDDASDFIHFRVQTDF